MLEGSLGPAVRLVRMRMVMIKRMDDDKDDDDQEDDQINQIMAGRDVACWSRRREGGGGEAAGITSGPGSKVGLSKTETKTKTQDQSSFFSSKIYGVIQLAQAF